MFKKKFEHDSIHFPQGFKLFRSNLGQETLPFKKGIGKVFLPKLGYVDFVQHRKIPNDALFTIKNVFLRRKAHKWFISF